MNGYTEKMFDKIMLFSGTVKDGKEVEGTRKVSVKNLIYVLSDFERRLCKIESILKINN